MSLVRGAWVDPPAHGGGGGGLFFGFFGGGHRGPRRLALCAWLIAACLWPAAAAADPAAGDAEPPDPTRLEVGALPAVAYDSDLGFGTGAVFTLARFHPAFSPYRWRLLGQLYFTIKGAPGGGLELPFHEDYVELDLPGDRVRLGLRLAFSRYRTSGYYGLGQDSEIDAEREAMNPRAYQYDRTYPDVRVGARLPLSLARRLDLVLSGRVAYNAIRLYPDSQLAEDAAAGRVAGAEDHLLAVVSTGLLLDSRDHESAPTRGYRLEGAVRAGAGVGARVGHAGATLDARLFIPLWPDRLVLGARGWVDALLGDPPVYELALGGGNTIRGVLGQRFHGKVKAVANLELRARLFRFTVARQRFTLGTLAFLDAGRVLEGYGTPEPGAAAGAGGGLRVQWGEHFIIRVDLGHSPTEGTTGLYINVSHLF